MGFHPRVLKGIRNTQDGLYDHPDPFALAPLVVETDASDYALAAILSTYTEDGELHPIAFHS